MPARNPVNLENPVNPTLRTELQRPLTDLHDWHALQDDGNSHGQTLKEDFLGKAMTGFTGCFRKISANASIC